MLNSLRSHLDSVPADEKEEALREIMSMLDTYAKDRNLELPMKRTFSVEVVYLCRGSYTVEAFTKDEAKQIAEEGMKPCDELPKNARQVDDTFKVVHVEET